MHVLQRNNSFMDTEQDYEQQYEEQQQKQEENQVIIEQAEPQESLITLVKQPQEEKEGNKGQKDSDNKNNAEMSEQKIQLISRLKGILQEKVEQIKDVKKSITANKREIKTINEQVDRQMNKSILKHSKPYSTVSIHSIFGTPKSSNPQYSQLAGQLAKIRQQSKKVKSEIQAIEHKLLGPVNLMNQERAAQYKAKIKDADAQIRSVMSEKHYIEVELKMMNEGEQYGMEGNDDQIKLNKDKNNQIMAQTKEEKNTLYEIDKEDRILTEKIRFFQELDFHYTLKKPKASIQIDNQSNKIQTEAEIKQLIQIINQIFDRRNKVQTQRKNLLKNLSAETAILESKNWESINKLRQIDAYLIKHYSAKAKKVKPKKDVTIDEIDTTVYVNRATPKQSVRQKENDKNMVIVEVQEQVQLVEKKKLYDFGMSPVSQTSITLNDEILVGKIALTGLSFIIDENYIYGIFGEYLNEKKRLLKGYKILPKIRPKDVVTQTLKIDHQGGQSINYMHIGSDKDGYIRLVHLITSDGKEFKWGKTEDCEKSEQKNIRKYQSIFLRGKLNQITSKDAPNYYCLGGLGFSIVYLSPK